MTMPDPNAGDDLAYVEAWEGRIDGREEELELERLAAAEEYLLAGEAWREKRYADSRRHRKRAVEREAHVRELEEEVT